MIDFIHYGKVKPKERPRNNYRTPKATKSCENDIAKTFRSVYPSETFKPYEGFVMIEFTYGYRPAKNTSKKQMKVLLDNIYCDKGGDIDNIEKTLLDALNGLAYLDDKQVVKVVKKKIYSSEFYLEVKIYELAEKLISTYNEGGR